MLCKKVLNFFPYCLYIMSHAKYCIRWQKWLKNILLSKSPNFPFLQNIKISISVIKCDLGRLAHTEAKYALT